MYMHVLILLLTDTNSFWAGPLLAKSSNVQMVVLDSHPLSLEPLANVTGPIIELDPGDNLGIVLHAIN